MIQKLNDSRTKLNGRFVALSGANIAVALASGAFGIVAIASPSALIESPLTSSVAVGFYSQMYGMRALVMAAGIVTASVTIRRAPLVAAIVLVGGGLVQLGDIAIAAHFATPGIVGASIATVVHLGSAGLLVRDVRHSRGPTSRDRTPVCSEARCERRRCHCCGREPFGFRASR